MKLGAYITLYKTLSLKLGLLAFITIFITACNSGGHTKPVEKSLYERLGGKPAITAVVDDLVANIAADTRINKFFAKTDIPNLKKLLVEQLCAGTGGPCTYTGRSMKDAHVGMGVSGADFATLVDDLVKSLNKFNVPKKEQNELLAILGPMSSDIMTK